MNYIVIDNETEIPLYGRVLLNETKRTGNSTSARIYKVPAEAWIAFLQVRYSHVPEVQAYLKAVEEGGGINPGHGEFLDVLDERIDVPEEEFRHGLILCGWDGNSDDGWLEGPGSGKTNE